MGRPKLKSVRTQASPPDQPRARASSQMEERVISRRTREEQRPSLISGWSEPVSLGWSNGEASQLAALSGRELVTEDLRMYLS